MAEAYAVPASPPKILIQRIRGISPRAERIHNPLRFVAAESAGDFGAFSEGTHNDGGRDDLSVDNEGRKFTLVRAGKAFDAFCGIVRECDVQIE